MNQLSALLLSLALELPVALLLGAAWGLLGQGGTWRIIRVGAACTLLTHPFAWVLLPALHGRVPMAVQVLVVEGGVAVVEGLLYGWLAGMGLLRGQLVGWVANGWSFGVGLLVLHWLGRD